MHLCAKNLLDY